MKNAAKNNRKVSLLALIAFLAVTIFALPATAADDTMNTNLNEIADQLTRWSKQSSTGKMSPEAQVKLSELLLEAGRMLKEMAMKDNGKMQMERHDKIQMMKKAWDPFDTADRM